MVDAVKDWMRGFFAPSRNLTIGAARGGDVALAALLVRAARANEDYDPRQIARIDAVLARRFGLGPFEAVALRRQAETYEAQVGDTVHLTRAIKDIVALEDRPMLLRDLWAVILADGARHEAEDGMMRLVSNLLGLADRDSAFARQDVQRAAGG
ncbi:MAG: TerB family tellurite resistance protein [Roseinatronobacter sp.]|jgi:uncharacterized tellurite resistance protein B-like protein|nr:TerB family tellurite resistance protein [Roseinatronobacter sp.]